MNKKRVAIFSLVGLLLAGTCAGGYYYFYYYKQTQKQETVAKDVFSEAYTGEILSSIKVLGETNLLQEQKLKFNIEGNVVGVYVSEGKKVSAGELLAEIDKGQLQNELKEANIKLQNSKINLQKVLDKFSTDDKVKFLNELDDKKRKLETLKYDYSNLGPTNVDKLKDEEIKLEKQKLDLQNFQDDLVTQKQKLTSDLADAKRDYEYKVSVFSDEKWKMQTAISDEQKSLNTKVNDYYKTIQNSYNQLDNDISSLDETLKTINSYLGIDNEYKKFDINIYFSATNATLRSVAESRYWTTKNKMISLRNNLAKYSDNTIKLAEIVELLQQQKDLAQSLYDLSESLSKAADYSLESQSFTQGDISSSKSFFNSTKSSAYSQKTTIQDLITKLNDSEKPETLTEKSRIEIQKLNKDISDLFVNLDKTKRDYDALVLSTPNKIKDLDLQLTNLQLAYKKALSDFDDFKYKLGISNYDKKSEIKTLTLEYETALKDFDKKYTSKEEPEEIQISKNEVKQAEIAIDQVNKKIESYEIRAPFDGVVDSFAMKVGDKLTNNATDEKIINLINPGVMEIKIKLDQIDVVKIKKGIEAQVTFDSYPDKVFTGVLGAPDSKPIDDNGMKKYQVKMIIDKGDLNIFSGMSANVDIVLDKVSDAILVPTMSIETDQNTGMSYVTLQKNAKKLKQTVEVGLNGNGVTQILSGVTVGDKVLEINFDANAFKPEDFVQPGYGAIPY